MKAYVITLSENETSNIASDKLIESSKKVNNDFDIEKYDAIVPDQVDELMKQYNIKWTYPWIGRLLDLKSGLMLSAYETADPKKRIACFLSHYQLWKKCVELNEPLFIFEHDALFTSQVDLGLLSFAKYDIIALNNPIGATRKSREFHDKVKNSPLPIMTVPKIDDDQIPQGLPGNSAYYIKPKGALKLLGLVKEHGAWPNDAIMCKQLLPGSLGIVRDFYTTIQGIQSTTTL